MSYEVKTMKEALFGNPYVGRGIVIAALITPAPPLPTKLLLRKIFAGSL